MLTGQSQGIAPTIYKKNYERLLISDSAVRQAISKGERIEEYPEDKPFPSTLMLGFVNKKPLHVVVGIDEEVHICYVITVYEPEAELWQSDFKKRKVL